MKPTQRLPRIKLLKIRKTLNLYLGTDLACDHVATHGALEEPLGQGGDRVAATHHHSGQCDQLVNVFGIQGPHTLRLVGVVGSDLNDKTIMRMIIDLVLILPLQLFLIPLYKSVRRTLMIYLLL